jgi:protein-tyrosine phosphatase
MEESLSMARKAVEDGIHTIVATPHTLDGIYVNPFHEISSRGVSLQDVFSKNHINLRLCVGADVHLCPNLLERINSGDAGTINNDRRYILLEIPSQTIPPGIKDEIFALKVDGITPIITHPERHPRIQHDMDDLYEFVSMGALCQVTAMSITGDFGETVMECAEKMLRHRLVHVIASDAHSSDSRPPVLSPAVEAAAEIMGSYEEAERMVTEVPAAILAGEKVEIPDPVRAKGGHG